MVCSHERALSLDGRGEGEMLVVETIARIRQGSSGEGRSDQDDRPGFEGFEEHGAQGGAGR